MLDASAILEVLLRTPVGVPLARRLQRDASTLHAPHLIDLETLQVLRRLVRTREITGEHAAQALQALRELPLERYPHRFLLSRIWELRENLTAYDAAYVALAEWLGATLVTRDQRLLRAPHTARVEVV